MLSLKRRDKTAEAILSDLKAAGYSVDSLEDVGVVGDPPPTVSAILANWVGRVPPKYTQRLNRAVARVGARSAPKIPSRTTGELIQEFRTRNPIRGVGFTSLWDIGDEIYRKYSDRYFDDVSSLAVDRQYGVDRQMLVLSLGKSKRPEAVSVLLGLLDDYPVSGHATEALARLRSEAARPGLSRMLSDDRDWVRTQARKGLKYLDEASFS